MAVLFEAVTPDSVPADEQCRALFIPNEPHWIAAVTGALELLTLPGAWGFGGTLTPDQAASAWVDFFDRFCFREGTCRVVGEIIPFAGNTSPDPKWLACDGSNLVRADYPDLFAVIGTIYGAADSSHFNLPDLQGRAPIMAGSGSGLSVYAFGDIGGEETHTLTVAESPSHSHSDAGHTHSEGIALPSIGAAIVGVPIPSAIPSASITGLGFASISSAGGDGAHNNLQPLIAINYLIVALP